MSEQIYYYDAFISYRHNDRDKKIVDTLQKLVENFRSPCDGEHLKKGERIKRVFTDRSELPMSADLGASIKGALEQSRFLVVIASPEYTQSRWCMEELKTFLFNNENSTDRILFVQVDGEPSCITDILSSAGLQIESDDFKEPLYIDARATSVKDSLKIIKKEYLRLAAVLIGCGYDALYQRNKRKKRRTILLSAIATFLLLAVVGSVFAVQLYQRKRESDFRYIDANISNIYELVRAQRYVDALEGMNSLNKQFGNNKEYAEYLAQKLENAIVKSSYVPSLSAFAGEEVPFDTNTLVLSSDEKYVMVYEASAMNTEGEMNLVLYDIYLNKLSEHTFIVDEYNDYDTSDFFISATHTIDYFESDDTFEITLNVYDSLNSEQLLNRKYVYSSSGEFISKQDVTDENNTSLRTESLYQTYSSDPNFPVCKSDDSLYMLLTKGKELFSPYGEKDEEYNVVAIPEEGDVKMVATLKRTSEMHVLDDISLTDDTRFVLVKETQGVYNDVITVCDTQGEYEGIRIDLGDHTLSSISDVQYRFDKENEVASFLFNLHVVGKTDENVIACCKVSKGELLGCETYDNEFTDNCVLSQSGYIYVTTDTEIKAIATENMCLPERLADIENDAPFSTDLSHNDLITEPDAFFYNSTAGMENETVGNLTICSDIARMHQISPGYYSSNDLGVGIDTGDLEELVRFYTFEFKHAYFCAEDSTFGLIDYAVPENSEIFTLYDFYSLMELIQ